MNNKESLKKVIDLINTGAKYPALQLVKNDPETAALVSKLVKTRVTDTFNIDKAESHYNLNQSQIQGISDKIKNRIKDNENVLQLFPDIELAVQILVSSILSPKDMVKNDLIYTTLDAVLPAELMMKLNSEVQTHLEGHYKIKDELPTAIRDALFDTGSYIKAVIPESIVDEIINSNKYGVSQEAYSELFKNPDEPTYLGILGNSGNKPIKPTTALENFRHNKPTKIYDHRLLFKEGEEIRYVEENISITDNYKLLKLPKLNEALNKAAIKNILKKPRVATESDKKNLSSHQLTDILYKSPETKSNTFLVVPSPGNAKRKSIGRPLVMKLPSEATIPIYTPGNERNHIGYFVLTDIDGNPVTLNTNLEYMEGLSSLMHGQNQNQSLSSLLISKAKRNLTDSQSEPTLDQVTKVYASIVEKDLIDRLRNGLYGTNAEIGDNQEIYRIMLARSLASMYTRLVFIPGELVTYFAFKYFSNGVGKSYLDDIKILSSLRAIMLFSKVMAQTKNSIALTHINMTLDPNDPDPQKTIEMSIGEIVKMRQQYFPLGINSPVDLVDWVQRAGLEFSFEGHPGLPQVKFDFETKQMQHILPDSDLEEQLRKQTYMTFGLSPETVDNGFNSEFATTVVSNNILLSKRVIMLQEVFTGLLADYSRKLISNDTYIVKDLMEVLTSNKGLVEKSLSDEEKEAYNADESGFLHDLLDRYIENFVIELPKPDITTLETQSAAFDQYTSALDKTIDSWINSQFITSEFVGDVSGNIDALKEVVKSYFIRKWMGDNGYMPELNDIVTADEDGNPTMDIYDVNKGHMEGVVRSTLKFIQSLQNLKNAANADISNMNVEPGETSSSSDYGSEETSGGDEFGFGGGDEFGFGGGEETPAEGEEAPAEETPTEEGSTEEPGLGF